MPDVRMPDGTVVKNVPEGTTRAQLQARITKQQMIESLRKYDYHDLITNKMTLGLSDKAVPLADAGIDWLRQQFTPTTVSDLVSGKKRKSFGELYQQHQAEQDQKRSDYKAAHPGIDWLTLPFNFMGAGPGKALTAPMTMRQVAGSGALTGLLAGAGGSRGSTKDQLSQTEISALFGALTAPVVAKAVSKVSPVVSKLATAINPFSAKQSAAPGPSSKAVNEVLAALNNQGMSPADAGVMMDQARARGVPLALGDTGDETRGLLAGLVRKPGPNRTLINDVVIPRQESQLERIQGALQRDLGPTVGVSQESARLADAAKTAASPLYEKAYATPLPDDEILSNIINLPAMKAAIKGGRQIHADEVALALAKGEAPPPPLPDSGVDVRTLDFAKRALQKQIDAAYSGDSAAKMHLENLKGVRDAMLERLDKVVPAYAEARSAYRGPKEMADALELGKSLVSKSADEILSATSKLTPAELEQVRLGYRSGLSDTMESRVDTADKVKAIVGTPKKRAALTSLFGGNGGIDNFLSTLGDESMAAKTFTRAATGSPTTANDADLANINAITGLGIKTAKRALDGQSMGLNAALTLRDLAHYGLGKQGERVRTELATLLTETDPAVLAEFVRGAATREAAQKAARAKAARAGNIASLLAAQQVGRALPEAQ